MKAKPKAKAKRIVVSASELRKLDAAARKRDLRVMAEHPDSPVPLFLEAKAPGVGIKWHGRI